MSNVVVAPIVAWGLAYCPPNRPAPVFAVECAQASPDPSAFETLIDHPIAEGERLDNLTAAYLDDPEQFWRLCDANRAVRPTELTDELGAVVRITLPEGIAGPR